MTEQNANDSNVVELKQPSKARAFLKRNRTKIVIGATVVAAGTVFVLGRQSKELVEAVNLDVDVVTPPAA